MKNSRNSIRYAIMRNYYCLLKARQVSIAIVLAIYKFDYLSVS
jgi:hypothetical protein